jgi:ADP-glucose pyrophosphorylase
MALTGLAAKVKLVLRITGDDLDPEILDMIEEAGEDMERLGIAATAQSTTALGRKATVAYCKSRYATDVTEIGAYHEAYITILDEMRRSAAYRAEVVE